MRKTWCGGLVATMVFGLSEATLWAQGAAAAAPAASPAPAGGSTYMMNVIGSLGSLVIGLMQLIVGLVIVTFAINKGLQLVSKLLGGLDIFEEVKKKNIAVALLGAGVVLSYTNVIGSGLQSMTKPIAAFASAGWAAGLTGLFSGLLNLAIAIGVASFAITVTFKAMDRLTKGIDEKAELAAGNVAIGALYCGVLIGVSQVVANAVGGVGTAVQSFLVAIFGLK